MKFFARSSSSDRSVLSVSTLPTFTYWSSHGGCVVFGAAFPRGTIDVGGGWIPTIEVVGDAVKTGTFGFAVTTDRPGLIGSDTTVGCFVDAELTVDHRCPVPFWPSRGRFVITIGGKRVGVDLVAALSAFVVMDAFVAVAVGDDVGAGSSLLRSSEMKSRTEVVGNYSSYLCKIISHYMEEVADPHSWPFTKHYF